MTSQYNYCGSDLTASIAEFNICMSCLGTKDGAQTLINYLKAMIEGCQQRPSPGTALKLDFDPFNAVSAFANLSSTSATTTHSSTSGPTISVVPSSTPLVLTSTSLVLTSISSPPAATTSASSSANNAAMRSIEALKGCLAGGIGVLVIIAIALLIRRFPKRKAKAATQEPSDEDTDETDEQGSLDQVMPELSSQQEYEVDGQSGPYEPKSEWMGRSLPVELGFNTPKGSVRRG
ncbi:hypothetical protein MMC30_007094 [Trapelia coarctata]|nr:hypothetical protein [Trapelia coarctata]